jgi:hypothetical protein
MERVSCVRPRKVAYILEYAVRRIKYSRLHGIHNEKEPITVPRCSNAPVDTISTHIRSNVRESGGWIHSLQVDIVKDVGIILSKRILV